MEQQIQSYYDNKENEYLSQQEIISDLSEECAELRKALKDTLAKVQESHPELILKYGAMIND